MALLVHCSVLEKAVVTGEWSTYWKSRPADRRPRGICKRHQTENGRVFVLCTQQLRGF